VPREVGVYLRGRGDALRLVLERIDQQIPEILEEVPGLQYVSTPEDPQLGVKRSGVEFISADGCRAWLAETIQNLVNSLRLRLLV
jgi:hypothetical protein